MGLSPYPSTESQEMFREERGQGFLVLSVQVLPSSVTPQCQWSVVKLGAQELSLKLVLDLG